MKNLTFQLLIALALTACASQRPVLYPNTYYHSVGRAGAETDIDDCMVLANSSGANKDITSETMEETAEGAVIGGATGAATGAVFGRAATGAAAGAAGGAAAGLTHGLIDADNPDQVFVRFVDKCLTAKGYDVVGWN